MILTATVPVSLDHADITIDLPGIFADRAALALQAQTRELCLHAQDKF